MSTPPDAVSANLLPIELETKPDMAACLARIDAWYAQEIIDRPPVRFSRHNALYAAADADAQARYPSLRDWWLDAEEQVARFERTMVGKRYHGETFPIFWPNLGPNVLAACFGAPLTFGEVTSWAEPILREHTQQVRLDLQSPYLACLDAQTELALQMAPGRFVVGYTDIHPGIDWLAALRGTQELLFDLYDAPEAVQSWLGEATRGFLTFYDHFDARLKAAGQPSISWMEIPAPTAGGRMHIPSCDFATMVSPDHFVEFIFPSLADECRAMTHNIFHMDGKGVARHLDAILQLPNVQAVQWVQGVADDMPILQWVPLIRRIQAAGRSVVVDLQLSELEPFLAQVEPEGIYLCVGTESEEQELAILKRLMRW
jgi:hypothetical protein